jgi:hypothetical protein
MRRALSLSLALLLTVGVVWAIVASVRNRDGGGGDGAEPALVRGVSGSEKESFFRDPEVQAAFARNGLKVQVDYAGSREIASLDLGGYGFAFPAGVPAAEKIRRERKVRGHYEPFFSPMAVATFKPIADLLVRNKVARPLGSGYYQLDMHAYLDLVARNARWTDLAGNSAYPARKALLIASTDVRTSNSAAQYLAISSNVANGDNIVQSRAQADKVLPRVAPLFLRQGFTEASSEGPFEDYLAIGAGKTPMVMIYEAQFLARAAAHDPAITPDRVLMYPDPTVLTKHTLVPFTPDGDRVGQLLVNDPDLKRLAVKYGFRTADAAAVKRYLSERKVAEPPALVNVVDPPVYEVLEYLITRIQQQIQG